MLETYPALPPTLPPVKDGMTATQISPGQLELVDDETKKLAVEILKDDIEALIIRRGNFLRDKLQGLGKTCWTLVNSSRGLARILPRLMAQI